MVNKQFTPKVGDKDHRSSTFFKLFFPFHTETRTYFPISKQVRINLTIFLAIQNLESCEDHTAFGRQCSFLIKSRKKKKTVVQKWKQVVMEKLLLTEGKKSSKHTDDASCL